MVDGAHRPVGRHVSTVTIGHRAYATCVPTIVAGPGAAHGAVANGGHAPTAWMMRVRTPHRARGHHRGACSPP
jgi:hypothetical protein